MSSSQKISPKIAPDLSLTFDDVLLRPGPSDVLPSDVEFKTQLTKEISSIFQCCRQLWTP